MTRTDPIITVKRTSWRKRDVSMTTTVPPLGDTVLTVRVGWPWRVTSAHQSLLRIHRYAKDAR